jgi:hypothetical protein
VATLKKKNKKTDESVTKLLTGTKETIYNGVTFRNVTVPGKGWAVIGCQETSNERTNQKTVE